MDARALSRAPYVIAWLALVAATAVSTAFGDGAGPAKLAGVVVLAVAFVKVRVVGRYFMELNAAPMLLRRVFDGYVVIVAAGLILIYLLAG